MPPLDVTRQFEVFVRAHQNMVFAVAVRLLGDAAEAEDISQTVFLKAWQHFASLGGNPAAAGWLRTVATNASLNHLARHRRRWRLFSEMERDDAETGSGFAETLPAASPTAEAAAGAADTAARLETALRSLPAQQRVPLVLFHFEQQSYQDIAARLGVSLGKVKTDIHRGREALKHLLKATDGSR
jgi:RNA polymerase sigma-70 factor (ECF subfamily)